MAGNVNSTTMDKNGNPGGGFAAGGLNAQGQWQQNPGGPIQNTAPVQPTPTQTPAPANTLQPAPSPSPGASVGQQAAASAIPNSTAFMQGSPSQQAQQNQARNSLQDQTQRMSAPPPPGTPAQQPQWSRSYGQSPAPPQRTERPRFYGQSSAAPVGTPPLDTPMEGASSPSLGEPPAFGAPDTSILPADAQTQGPARDPIHQASMARPTLKRY